MSGSALTSIRSCGSVRKSAWKSLSGRDPSPPVELLSGDASLTQVVATARVLF
jgi:hypothetical protein